MKFSCSKQAFYDENLKYQELPDDLVDITIDQHDALLQAINSGCVILSDLTASTAKPDQYFVWSGSDWVDNRTDAEKLADLIASLPSLNKRQFNLYLYDNNKLDEVNTLLAANPRAKIEFDSTDKIERSSSTVTAMITALGWTDDEVNAMWQEALTL